MSQRYFDKLLEKYLAGQCNKAEEILVHEWYQQRINESKLQISDEEKEQIRNRIWSGLDIKNPKQEIQVKPFRHTKVRTIFYRAAVAAAIIIAVMGMYWYFQPSVSNSLASKNDDIPADLVSSTNNSKLTRELKLSDGSIVSLEPGAAIYYPKIFDAGLREVHLTGDAFFKVSHDSSRRFLVHAASLVTEVLGTSFYIHQDQTSNKMEVEVVTGKVSVYQERKRTKNALQDPQTGSVILTKNQKVTYNATNSQFITSLVEEPKPIGQFGQPGNTAFVYDDAPVAQVLAELRTAYGIEITTDNSAIANCRFTGDITKQDLYKKLEIICQSLPSSSYEVRGLNIIVKGKGCNDDR